MNEPRRPPSPESQRAGYELTDVNPFALGVFALGLAITIAVSVALMAALFWQFEAIAKRDDPVISPLAGKVETPKPHLETSHGVDLVEYRREENARLRSYGWIDRREKIARIPIDRAIQLLAERGIPEPVAPKVPKTEPGPKQESIKEPAQKPAQEPMKEPAP
jgi:hypothetical protein